MGARLDRLYARLGPNYIRPYLIVLFALASGLAVVGAWVFSFYVEMSFVEFLELAAVAFVASGVGIGWSAAYGTPRYWGPIRRWIEAGRPADGAATAWESAVNYSLNGVRSASWRCFIVAAVPSMVYAALSFDLSLRESLILLAAILAAAIYPTLILAGLLDYYLRPVVRDAGDRIPIDQEHPRVRLPLRIKMMGTLPLIAVISGLFVSVFSSSGDPSLDELGLDVAVAVLVAGTVSLLLVAIVAESLMTPVESLMAGTRRVRGGDLTTRLPVVSDDELGVLTSSFNEMTADLKRSREQLLTAQEQERRRMRRDLHDGLGPVLSGIGLQLDAASNLLDQPERAREHLRQSRHDLGAAIEDVRRLIYELRPPALDRLGLVGAIRDRAQRLAIKAGGSGEQAVSFSVDADSGVDELPAVLEIAALRIAEEAMTNVVRHSGASSCRVELSANSVLQITVSDDGQGIPVVHGSGVGLASMAERAQALGGTLELANSPTGGAIVTARLPLHG